METFVPGTSLDDFRKRLAGVTTATPDGKPLNRVSNQGSIKSLSDQVWESTNAAEATLVKRSGQADVSKKLANVHKTKEVKQQHQQQQQKKPPPVKREREEKHAEEEQEQDSVLAPLSKARMVDVPAPDVMPNLRVETLEQHTARDDQLELFAQAVTATHGRAPSEMVIKAPPKEEILNTAEDMMREWYYGFATLVANTPGQKFPDVPCFSRQMLIPFMREADPLVPWERPCFNLDREPHQGEERIRCIAHRMSEKWAQVEPRLGGPFRLREMLFNDEEAKILALPKGYDPKVILPSIPEMCILCNIWIANVDYIDQKDKVRERSTKDHTTAPPNMVTICNRFMVRVDQEGEYDSRRGTITCDRNALGIWGPFPVFNENNYIPYRYNGRLRGVKETDNLLFRLSRAASTPTPSGQGTTTSH